MDTMMTKKCALDYAFNMTIHIHSNVIYYLSLLAVL